MRLLFVLLFSATAVSAAEIDLSKVHSNGMPGTADIRDLEPEFDGAAVSDEEARKRSAYYRLGFCLTKHVAQSPGPIAVVPGRGRKAMAHVADVYCKEQRFQLQPGDEATIGFCTGLTANDITITGVKQDDAVVTIQIEITPRMTTNLTAYIALIPITLPEGDRLEIRYSISRPAPPRLKPSDAKSEAVLCTARTLLLE
jgi:hypothetical protein